VSILNYFVFNYSNVFNFQQICNLLIVFSKLNAESSWFGES